MISDSPVKLAGLNTEHAVLSVRSGAGWTPLDRLSLIRVSGPQRVKFLHGLLSNDIAGLQTGESRPAALMNLKGHQIAWMRVMAEDNALICELPRSTRDLVVETFIHYKVGAPVRFEKMEGTCFGLLGSGAAEALRGLGFQGPPSRPETFLSAADPGGILRLSRGHDLPADGFTLHADPGAADAVRTHLLSAIGEPIAPSTLETLRVEEGIPWHGIDVLEENLLHETGQLERYHSPAKGCYLGQEVVARLEGRGGNVNRKLRGLRSDQAMSAGDEITADGKAIGRVTSAGRSPEFGPIAMGYVHRTHADPGAEVMVAGHGARVVALPFRS